MATNLVHRFCSLPRTLAWASLHTRNISTSASLSAAPTRSSPLVNILRPLVGAISAAGRVAPARCFATDATSSSLTDPKADMSNKPRREAKVREGSYLEPGCDFEHWFVFMEPPEGTPTRDEIIDSYIKTLASVVGSEEEARMKIYSVSTRYYYAFGALVSEELSEKISECPGVQKVLPDSYFDIENKDYGWEPFINGQAVPYDPKYHELYDPKYHELWPWNTVPFPHSSGMEDEDEDEDEDEFVFEDEADDGFAADGIKRNFLQYLYEE
ncbi:hypothetical protein FNV43_RR04081 [Rhamnella rubrinervis]|uniref:MORF/ORRM1/DAG-like MORF domain-containing protein n=1 Tax=Rhamnella rubrinervis TaxID=2594499 RepID=A0A8K0HJN9_9ROSA|nr:hypothetical protein FNV43_RR04081 [Rhamnella rubrinervis]